MSVEKEKMVSREEIYDGQIVHLFKDQVELAGRKAVRKWCSTVALLPSFLSPPTVRSFL